MKIAIISGSHRANAESLRVAKFIDKQCQELGANTDLISLSDNPLPLWDESIWEGADSWKKAWTPYANRLQSCDSLVVVSPEWAGMAPPGLKNFLLLCTAKEVGHKPALIATVSSSRGGSYPVNELRTSGYKNNRLCVIPEHLIIRDVNHMLHGESPASEDDKYIRSRIAYACKLLLSYSQALNSVRDSGVIDHTTFPNGM